MNFAYLLHKELRCDGRVEHWLRNVITWHQLVEWYQWYQLNPFGEHRADLRSAIAGCAIANEIRVISAGLSGVKNPKMVQVDDLMPKLDLLETSEQKAKRDAEEYYRKWKQSKDERLAEMTSKVPKPKQSRVQSPARGRKR